MLPATSTPTVSTMQAIRRARSMHCFSGISKCGYHRGWSHACLSPPNQQAYRQVAVSFDLACRQKLDLKVSGEVCILKASASFPSCHPSRLAYSMRKQSGTIRKLQGSVKSVNGLFCYALPVFGVLTNDYEKMWNSCEERQPHRIAKICSVPPKKLGFGSTA